MSVTYETKFGSLNHFEKGRVEPIDDDVRHYAFSNCFETASKSKPYEKVVFGQNQIYVLEVLRAEGASPWYTCFTSSMVSTHSLRKPSLVPTGPPGINFAIVSQ